jgi:hypothetical protein
MTLRTKTLWYATQRAADVVDATLTALPQITIYTENSSRTFRSVQVWVSYEDISTATGATVGEHRVACSVNGATATTFTELDDIANSGENMAGIFGPVDFTSHFTTNYPAADSTTLDISVYFDITTGTGLDVRNVAALIAITYEYDDGAATQYSTAIIPMESLVGAMATTESEIGTNQIPQLTGSGGLLENVAGVTVRQQFFIVEGNSESGASATDYTLNVRIDTGTTHAFGISEMALASDCYKRFVHIESPSPSAAHAWKAWTTGVGRLNMASHTMYVTYQWTVSGTTEFLNSVMLPFSVPNPLGGSTSTDNSRATVSFQIEEPGTITLKQSAYRIHFVPGAAPLAGLNSRAGGQAYRAYTSAASMICGGSCFQQRIDSGSAQGSGFSAARGKNTLVIDAYRTDTTDLGWGVSGVAIINYKSGVSVQGVGAHNHTICWLGRAWDALASSFISATFAPNIPETNYWVNSVGYYVLPWDAAATNDSSLVAENLSGEGPGDGWRQLGISNTLVRDAERGVCIEYRFASDDMQRWPLDTDPSRMGIEASRQYLYVSSTARAIGLSMLLTYHTITFTISGNISGSSGGTVDIDIFTENGNEITHIGSTSRTGNGAYSLTWYDNVLPCFAEARESGTLVGRSDNAVASGSP